jgi:hypothetical protein
VLVVPHDVPAAGVAHHAPGLEPPGRGLAAGPLVVELHDLPITGGLPEHVEGRLVGAEPRTDHVERPDVDRDPGRRQLADRAAGRLREPGVLPDLGGEAHDLGLVAGQLDLRQLGLVGPDPVAGLVVEVGVELADLDRDSERAEVVLVALEHPLERLVRRVGVEQLADPLLGDVAALHEQHDEEVEQTLALLGRHVPPPDQAAPRMSTTK